MDSIDQLLMILEAQRPGDQIHQISVAPWSWMLLKASVQQRFIVSSGFEPDEPGPLSPSAHPTIRIDLFQEVAYRLWDREGRELFGGQGWLVGPLRGDC